MKRFEAGTLEGAFEQAAQRFGCSVTELNVEVVQLPSKGFLGFGKKSAIIAAKSVTAPAPKKRNTSSKSSAQKHRHASSSKPSRKVPEPMPQTPLQSADAEKEEPACDHRVFLEEHRDIFDNFYQNDMDNQALCTEIRQKVNTLFGHSCFALDSVNVSMHDETTVFIEFNGQDAALLIGKEGYRYKALHTLLHSWIQTEYHKHVRIEVAEFLHNQEQMVKKYLESVIQKVADHGKAQTKVLDGILGQIALDQLRTQFPEKYVALRTNKEGGRYVIVSPFKNQSQ